MVVASVIESLTVAAAIVGALGISGLIGARLQADRDRQERLRERMIEAADDFVTSTMGVATILQRAAAATTSGSRSRLLGEADAGYKEAYGHVGRLGILFPGREDAEGRLSGAY